MMFLLAFINFTVSAMTAATFAADPSRPQFLGFAVWTFGVGILAAIRSAKS